LLPQAVRQRELSAEMRLLARRYAYTFFFRFQQPFPWVNDEPRTARRLAMTSLTDLRPGADRDLDRICDGILRLTPFVAAPSPSHDAC
jgi:hypothetical protein